jgi:hypothetical protein
MLFDVILTLIAIGVIMYLINRYIPMEPNIKNIINAVVIIAIVFWLLRLSGILGSLDVPFPRVR